ncbi:hypothetical protein PIB30_109421, partial [Stylosanthes scabra]|nr:hypothetical protein [Stylosanthes scabra]
SSVAGASVNPKPRYSFCLRSLFVTPCPSPHPLSFVAGGPLRRCSVTLSALPVFQGKSAPSHFVHFLLTESK